MKLLQWISAERPSDEWFSTYVATLTDDDVLLLRQDGVYAMLLPWPELPCRCYALQLDVAARAINTGTQWQTISDQQWVELTAQAKQVWLCPTS